jgi:hypothetical protein
MRRPGEIRPSGRERPNPYELEMQEKPHADVHNSAENMHILIVMMPDTARF